MAKKKSWSDMTPGQRAATLTVGAVQLALAATAWADLARRPAESVNGSKAKWAAIIALNFVGPASYFKWGRRTGA